MSEKRLLRNINKKLCQSIPAENESNSKNVETLLQLILDELQSHTEEVTPTLYCDENCNVTGAISFVRLENATGVVPIYFDSNLQVTTVAPLGVPCTANCGLNDYEFKFFEKEICIERTRIPVGESSIIQVTEVLCILFVNGIEESTSTFWVQDGVKLDTIPSGNIIDCVNELPCVPAQESFLGNNATLTEFNQFTVFIPKCCAVTISTSAGNITLPAQETSWVYADKFECNLTNYSIVSSCVDIITTVLTKTK